jgi:glycogen(starch) synthase
MKILMMSEDIPGGNIGGLARHAVTLARSLSQAGHEVDFMGNNLVPYDEGSSDISLPGRFFPDLNMKHIGFKEVRMGIYNPLRRPFVVWRFARAIKKRARDYDVVHYHGHFPLLANYVPKNINFVQTRHDQGSDCLIHTRFKNHDICKELSSFSCASCAGPHPNVGQRLVSAYAVWLYRRLVARAFLRHKTIFVSDMLRQNFSRTAGKGNWGTIIHNFIDFEALRPYAHGSKTPTGIIEVFFAGKLYEPKGINAFLEQINGLVPSNMRITIAGDGENEEKLRKRYSSDRVVLLGWQSYANTMELMHRADIVLVSSICEESCATTILEALALGKRVCALARGGTPELAKYQGYAGQLSLFEDMEALVRGLVNLQLTDFGYHDAVVGFGADVSVIRDEIIKIYLEKDK